MLLFIAGALSLSARAEAEEVDRLLGVAAGRAITWSAALREANAEAFLEGRAPVQLSLSDPGAAEQLRAVAGRLGDQMIIERARQDSAFAAAGQSPDNGANSAGSVQAESTILWESATAAYDSPAKLSAALRRYGLAEDDLRQRLMRQQLVMAFMDYSLRPQVRLEPERVVQYYNDEFKPKYQQEQPGSEPPELDEVRTRVEEVLIQREMNQLMGPWLQGLRNVYGFRWIVSSGKLDR